MCYDYLLTGLMGTELAVSELFSYAESFYRRQLDISHFLSSKDSIYDDIFPPGLLILIWYLE